LRLILLYALLFVIAGVVTHRIGQGEFNIHVDETFHACTGMFVADFLRAAPIAHPIQFTYTYYAHYPAIGLIHWPPFFYFAEAIVFLVGGLSVVTARLTVLLFALLGFYFWFKLVEEFEDSYFAAASTAMLALLPFVFSYEKAVMLEIPSLALCIAASYFWIRYLKEEHNRDVYIFASMAILALLTKQLAIYLVLFCLFSIVSERKWYLLSKAAVWKALILTAVVTAPFYLLALRIHWKVIQYDAVKTVMPGNPFLAYFRMLPTQLGLPILCLSVFGIATSWWWGRWEHSRIMLIWIAACYFTLTPLAEKEPRYIIYWLPAFTYFAVGPFISARLSVRLRGAGAIAALVLLGSYTWIDWKYQRPFIAGYADAAKTVTGMSESGFILFDGDLPANFIFYVRKFDPGRHFVVLRKALYAEREMKQWGSVEFVKSNQDLENLIAQYGIRFIVVDNSPTEFHAQELLREYLHSPRFRLVKTVEMETNIPSWTGRRLFVYENVQPVPCSAKTLHLEMMSLPNNFDISPSDLGIDCTTSPEPVSK
jgi:hypothetical protein